MDLIRSLVEDDHLVLSTPAQCSGNAFRTDDAPGGRQVRSACDYSRWRLEGADQLDERADAEAVPPRTM
jgi:hypothetical protein